MDVSGLLFVVGENFGLSTFLFSLVEGVLEAEGGGGGGVEMV